MNTDPWGRQHRYGPPIGWVQQVSQFSPKYYPRTALKLQRPDYRVGQVLAALT
jgi:hypothetical protein